MILKLNLPIQNLKIKNFNCKTIFNKSSKIVLNDQKAHQKQGKINV